MEIKVIKLDGKEDLKEIRKVLGIETEEETVEENIPEEIKDFLKHMGLDSEDIELVKVHRDTNSGIRNPKINISNDELPDELKELAMDSAMEIFKKITGKQLSKEEENEMKQFALEMDKMLTGKSESKEDKCELCPNIRKCNKIKKELSELADRAFDLTGELTELELTIAIYGGDITDEQEEKRNELIQEYTECVSRVEQIGKFLEK